MWKDPIVEEIRRARSEYAASLNNDIDRIFEDIKQRQTRYGKKLVKLPPRKPRTDTKSA